MEKILAQKRDRTVIGCGCGASWGGLLSCHCAADGCHRTFSGLSYFDSHRRDGQCLDPAGIKRQDGTDLMRYDETRHMWRSADEWVIEDGTFGGAA